MERENLDGDAKGKGTSGQNREAESTDAPARGGLLRSSDEVRVSSPELRSRAISPRSAAAVHDGEVMERNESGA